MLFPRLNAMGLKASGTASPDWPAFRKQVADIQESIRGLGLAGAPEDFWRMDPDAAAKDRETDRNRIYAPDSMIYALIVCSIIPILIIYPFIQKYFAKGTNVGGVKE